METSDKQIATSKQGQNMNDCTCSDPVETRPMFCAVHGPEDIVGNPTPLVWIEASKLATLERDLAECRAALIDANSMCRSAYTIANRIATDFSTHEMGTAFGPFADRCKESLERQHAVILALGGYSVSAARAILPPDTTGEGEGK